MGALPQALHIFRKDVRYLLPDIVLLLALAAVFGWMETHSPNAWWSELLLMAAIGLLVTRVIQAERVPGDVQFWVTRPYRWESLLMAKLLFLVTFVCLPLLAAQAYMLAAIGFPVVPNVGGLLCVQVLMLAGAVLPAAALAAITTSLVPCLGLTLAHAALGFAAAELGFRTGRSGPVALQWVENAFAVLLVAVLSAAILFLQYRYRRTGTSRWMAGVGLGLTSLAYWNFPWELAFRVQSLLARGPVDTSALGLAAELRPAADVNLRLEVLGVPPGLMSRADALYVAVGRSHGERAEYRIPDLNRQDANLFNAKVVLPTGAEKVQAARLYLTLLRKSQTRAFVPAAAPQYAVDQLLCAVGAMGVLHCRAPFRWPARLIYARAAGRTTLLTPFISYSPLPAGLQLHVSEAHWTYGPTPAQPAVTVDVWEPVVHTIVTLR